MKKIQRRTFLKKAGAAAIGSSALIAGCGREEKNSPAIINNKTYNWRMVTTWPPNFPILGEYPEKIGKWLDEISGGKFKITVYGGGELIPALETFDAVSQGIVEMGHSASYYWSGKVPALQFFTAVPFGMNSIQVNAWLYDGGGLELWREVYDPYNIFPFPAGNTGAQVGGWFNKEIKSVKDIQGLKMRMAGFGGKVITKSGMTSVLAPGGELYTNLERGVIDALEWIGPYHDYLFGFHEIAKFCYYPGWQEPTAPLELIVNKQAYNSLPQGYKDMLAAASSAANDQMLAEFESKNSEYYQKMLKEKIIFKKFPDDVLELFKKNTELVIEEMVAADPMNKKVYESYNKFRNNIIKWSELVEKNYL